MSLTIQLPIRPDQDEFNLKRWNEVLADPHYVGLDGTFETDRYGQVIHMPPPSFQHGRLQSKISNLLNELMKERGGTVATECPVSTSDGVKGIDVIWMTNEQLSATGNQTCVPFAPTLCVEIKSPRNTWQELNEKKALYFEAGAKEVWVCDLDCKMHFFTNTNQDAAEISVLCTAFPKVIELV